MSYDEMELDMIGDQRTAMFVIISDTDDTFNFVVAIMYTQLFNLLCDKADDEHGGRLPYHVRLLLDEFSNIGQIQNRKICRFSVTCMTVLESRKNRRPRELQQRWKSM